jgi:hypothetical protein
MKPQLVAWCAFCRHTLPVEDAGTRCPSTDCTRTMRKRRVWVCDQCPPDDCVYLRGWMYRIHRAAHVRSLRPLIGDGERVSNDGDAPTVCYFRGGAG